MKKLLISLALILSSFQALAANTTITASKIQHDVSGTLLTAGYLVLTPVDASNQPIGFTSGDGGQVLPAAKYWPITNGSVSGVTVPDTASTVPHVGYQVTITDSARRQLYTFSQPIYPTGSTWSLDSWSPSVIETISPSTTITSGSQAPSGACAAPSLYYESTTLYTCVGSTWTELVSGGGAESLPSIAANQVLMGPPNGSAAVAGPRALESEDLPSTGTFLGFFMDINGQTPVSAISTDGANWTSVQAITPSVDDDNCTGRDPNMVAYNGLFYVLYTLSGGSCSAPSPAFGITGSADGISWSTGVQVVPSGLPTVASPGVWAPAPYVDHAGGLHVLFSYGDTATDTLQIYETHALNQALTSWSDAVAVTGTSFPASMIDAQVYSLGGTYYLVYKNEVTKYIEIATSSSLTSGYTIIDSGNWAGWGSGLEAPYLVHTGFVKPWRFYMDQYGGMRESYSDCDASFANCTTPTAITTTGGYTFGHGSIFKIRGADTEYASVMSGLQRLYTFGNAANLGATTINQGAANGLVGITSSNGAGTGFSLSNSIAGTHVWQCYVSAGSSYFGCIDGSDYSWMFAMATTGSHESAFTMGSLGVYGWTWRNDDPRGAPDTAISRDSAGVVDIGTGAQGDKSGTLEAATGTFGTSVTSPSITDSGLTAGDAVCAGTGGLLTTDGCPTGSQGEQGPQGPAGPTGATGATGATGPAGADGTDASLPTCAINDLLYYPATGNTPDCTADITDAPSTATIKMLQGTTLAGSVTIGNSSNAHGNGLQIYSNNAANSPVFRVSNQYLDAFIIGENANAQFQIDAISPFIEQGHFVANDFTPTIAAGAGAGTSPTVSIVSHSHDMFGVVSVTTGTSPTASSTVVTVTAGENLVIADNWRCQLTPANAAAAALTGAGNVYSPIPASEVSAFTIVSGSTALSASTTYEWTYLCMEAG